MRCEIFVIFSGEQESDTEQDNNPSTLLPRHVTAPPPTASQTHPAGASATQPQAAPPTPDAVHLPDRPQPPEWLRQHSRMELALRSPSFGRRASIAPSLPPDDTGSCSTILDVMLRKQTSINSKIQRLALMRSKGRRRQSKVKDSDVTWSHDTDHVIAAGASDAVRSDDVTAQRNKKISMANSLYSLPENRAMTSRVEEDCESDEVDDDWSKRRSLNAMGVNHVLKVVRRESQIYQSLMVQ